MTCGILMTDKGIYMISYTIRQGRAEDAAALASVEAECFPAAEAATAEEIGERLSVYPTHFSFTGTGSWQDLLTVWSLMKRIFGMKCMKRHPSTTRKGPGR